MNRRVADELATILEWGAGLKDCRHLSPKALKLFKRGSVYYRKLSRGKPDAGDLMEYWKPLAELGPKDIEPGFMKGFCDERNLPRR